MLTDLPNLLTLSRIIIIPVLVGLFYLDGDGWRWVSVVLFTLAGVTDYFDGYLARKWAQISAFGRFLDPIADKLLVAAVILMLVATGRISGLVVLPALVILCREVMVSGLREFLAQVNVGVPVSRLAKWKTALQLIALVDETDIGAVAPRNPVHEVSFRNRWGTGLGYEIPEPLWSPKA